jgi:hypothetical protein
MKRNTKHTTNRSTAPRIVELEMKTLETISGGGLSGPDLCDGRYKIICIQDATPPSSQDC